MSVRPSLKQNETPSSSKQQTQTTNRQPSHTHRWEHCCFWVTQIPAQMMRRKASWCDIRICRFYVRPSFCRPVSPSLSLWLGIWQFGKFEVMVFNQGLVAGLSAAWHGMMAHFKDVGLGRGQAWVAWLEEKGGGGGGKRRLKERKIWAVNLLLLHPQHRARLAAHPQRPEWAALMTADYVWACV